MAIVILVCSLLLIAAFAVLGRKFSSQSEYWVNERDTPWWMIAASVSSSTVGAGTLFGVAAAGYAGGNAGAIIGIANSLGIIFFGFYIAPKITEIARSNNWYSVGEFISGTTGQTASKVSALVLTFAYFFFTAAQFAALSFVVKFGTGLNYEVALLISGGCILAYNFVGGLRADMRTDLLQLALMIIFIGILFPTILSQSNGLVADYVSLPPEYLTGTIYQGVTFLIAAIILIPLSVIPSVDLWQRSFAARSETEAKIGFLVGGVVMAALFTAFSLLGTFAFLSNPTLDANEALLHFSADAGSSIVIGLLLAGLFAAILSTADTMLLASSISFSKDFLGQEDFGRQKQFVILIGTICMGAALLVPDVVNLVINAFSTILILLPVILGIFFPWWRHQTSAIIAIIAGGIMAAVVFAIDPLIAFVPGTIISLFAYVVSKLVLHRK